MLTEQNAREVSEGIGHPGADEGQQIQVSPTLMKVMQVHHGREARYDVDGGHQGGGGGVDVDLAAGEGCHGQHVEHEDQDGGQGGGQGLLDPPKAQGEGDGYSRQVQGDGDEQVFM